MNKKLIYYTCGIGALIIASGILFWPNPKISVVMSTYNRQNFLPRAIDSVLNQTFSDFEFIITNDGSSDDTANILKKYAKQDSRIKILTNEQNKGLIYSLNRGLDAARGKYIARMDDDDISLGQRFEKQYQFMEKNPDITLTSSFVANPDDNRTWPFQKQTDSDTMKVELYTNIVPLSHPSIFVRRSFLEKHKIRYNEKYRAAEDRKFYLDLYDAGAKMGKVPEVLVYYRFHNTNPEQWYYDRWKNANLFLQDEILPRFDILDTYNSKNNCEIFHKMAEKNKTSNLLPQQLFERSVELRCPQNPVQHPQWSDAFIFNGNRVCRLNISKECGDIQSKTQDSFTIKWDHWGIETFVQKDGVWTLKKNEVSAPKKSKKANKKSK